MRAARTIQCSSCGARWAAATARFCGWCGVPLRRPTAPAPERGGARPRAALFASGAVVAVIGLAAIAIAGFELPRDRPDPLVELAEAEVVPQGAPLSPEERAEALAPFDPNRVRCEPDGCERWRVELTPTGFADVVPFGEMVVALTRDAIHAYDVESGRELWQAAWPADEGTRRSSTWTSAQATPDGALLVVARPEHGTLLALDPGGEVVWRHRAGSPWHNFALAGDVVVVSGPGGAPVVRDEEQRPVHPSENIEAFDARTGESLWQLGQVGLMNWSDGTLVVRDDLDIVLLDVRSGLERSRREAAPGAWLDHLGEFAVLYDEDGTARLLDGDDLETIAGLDDYSEFAPIGDGSRVVAIRRGGLSSEDGSEDPDRLALIEPDGAVRWESAMPGPPDGVQLCCPGPVIEGDAVVFTSRTGAFETLAFSLATGSSLATGGVEETTPPRGDNVWWITPETALEQRHDGVRMFHGGAELVIRGEGAWPVTMEPPFVFTNGRSLLSVQAVPTDGLPR